MANTKIGLNRRWHIAYKTSIAASEGVTVGRGAADEKRSGSGHCYIISRCRAYVSQISCLYWRARAWRAILNKSGRAKSIDNYQENRQSLHRGG